MRFRVSHLMIFMAAVAIQMSDMRCLAIGVAISIGVLFGAAFVLAYYSVGDYPESNPMPRMAEYMLGYAFLNLAIVLSFSALKNTLSMQL